MNKKGITLETAIALILIAISLAIIIILLLTSGLISSLQSIICTSLTTSTMFLRGFIVKSIWDLFWIFVGLITAIIWIFGSFCKGFPVGTAVCAVMNAVFIGVLTASFMGLTSGLPILYCPNPTITVGPFSEDCHSQVGVSKEVFFKEIADRSVDCWNMYARGEYDPLSGHEPPNPITCFVVDFRVRSPVSINEIVDWMQVNNYSSNISYLEKAGWAVVVQNNSETLWDKNLTKGRLFIKYGDDETTPLWASADCDIYGASAFGVVNVGFMPPDRKEYYKDFFSHGNPAVQLCQANCMSDFRANDCPGITDACLPCLQEIPGRVPYGDNNIMVCNSEVCMFRNKVKLGTNAQCPPQCIDYLNDDCTDACIKEVYANCATGFITPLWECNNTCKGNAPTNLPTSKDYVFWCFDKNVTCTSNCTTFIPGGTCI